MLTTTKEMLRRAQEGGYAVAAVNTQGGTYDIIRAVCMAAQELRSPVILAHYLSTGAYSGHDWFYQTAKWMAEKVDVPVAIHLDHGDTVDHCRECLELGFTSIMYDGSSLPLEENAANTNQVITACHERGVMVEAEIGQIGRLDAQGNNMDSTNVADPEQVLAYLELCSPDSLAVGIGNAHGFYKAKPEIHLEVLEAVRRHTDVPFVLHGCTGMDTEMIRTAVGFGVAKINFGTQVRHNYMTYLREGCKMDFQDHAWRLSAYAEERLRGDIREIIRLAGSEGRA
ncbi:MAG: class II fructose-bisphosphate aldolase [Oscillospiraceae bacterium]|jgi:ketose-bisphosphate aldolase|nr:class II fructose-bisphosphate aldolase [Oscillospiraceae bacterium]